MTRTEHAFEVKEAGRVSAILVRPAGAKALYVLAHGAGAGMRHPFLEAMAEALAAREVATLRYQFPYVEQGKKRPDPPHVLERTVRAAVAEAARLEPGLPLVAGGKSMGGRMTSQAAAKEALAGVRRLAFLGFPLHAPKKPGVERGEHLGRVGVPMLFLQGTRDAFARIDLLRPVVVALGDRATLHLVDGGDHSFGVPKSSGRTPADVIGDLAATLADWTKKLAPASE